MSEAQKIRDECDRRIKDLQKTCPHPKISGWIEHWWAFAHSSGYCVKICERCGKYLDQKDTADIPNDELPRGLKEMPDEK